MGTVTSNLKTTIFHQAASSPMAEGTPQTKELVTVMVDYSHPSLRSTVTNLRHTKLDLQTSFPVLNFFCSPPRTEGLTKGLKDHFIASKFYVVETGVIKCFQGQSYYEIKRTVYPSEKGKGGPFKKSAIF